MRSCGQKPPCCGGARCGQRREGRLDVSALPSCTCIEVTSCMLSALICTRAFRTVRESLTQDRYGSLLALSDSHASLTLRQSATRCGRAPTRRTHHTPTRRLSVSARAVSGHQTPGGMKLAAEQV